MLTINHEKPTTVDIIELAGILNADTSPRLEALLEPLANSDNSQILFHIPELTYISSAGIGCFIGVIKRIREKNGDIRFSGMAPKVKRVFKLLDMDDFFKFFDTKEQGIDSYNP
ncbi:STAS domain-containing protein [bacterium]|nr:STAS domain-containing protein [bacterium]